MIEGRLPLVFVGAGDGSVIGGVGGAESSSETSSPPRASRSSACLVFLLPSFMPLPLNGGVRALDAGAGDAVRAAGTSGASKR